MDDKMKSSLADGAGLISIFAGAVAYGWKAYRARRKQRIADIADVRVAEIEAESHTMDKLWERVTALEARIVVLEGERMLLAERLAAEKVEVARLRQVTIDQQEIMTEYEETIATLESRLAVYER